MSDRIVIALQRPVVGPPQLYLLEPGTHGAADQPLPLELDEIEQLVALARPPGAGQGQDRQQGRDRLQAFGSALFDKLMAHPAFESSVQPLLHLHPAHGEPFYLYFQHRMPSVEALPWEALFAPDVGFLSQNHDFAMARMLNTNSTKTEWLFEPPLKIVAVLGAGGVPGEGVAGDAQWASLAKAVGEAALPVRVKVLTCQDELRDAINQAGLEREVAGAPWVTAELISDRDQLFAAIRGFAPHILHFFCHGIATTRPQLQVATYRDWGSEAPGSILIEGEQLKQNADMDGNIWLVTLNCCETAKDGAGGSSLSMPVACNLVSGGIPVVVGMRERIDDTFANTFCALFYQSLLAELQHRLRDAAATGSTDVHWACGLFQVRQSMYANGMDDPAWTLPVMHTRLKRFQLKINPAHTVAAALPAGTAQAPARAATLSASDIHEYGEELMQLYEDQKAFAAIPKVAGRIQQRIDEINRALSA
jgi:hypothetical protein